MNDLLTHSIGSPALDQVLGGGLPAGSTTVVTGLPGTGKTILAEQFLFANASPQAPGLYLTTLSEPLDKVLRYLQGFSFFLPDRIPEIIHYQDIGRAIRDQGIGALPVLIDDLLADRQARFLVIDSFKALHDLSTDPVALRTATFDLGRVLTVNGVTALLVGEYRSEEIGQTPEFSIADGIIELINRAYGIRDERAIRVHKLRGAAHLPGFHSFRIDRDGIQVFPRLTGGEEAALAFPVDRVRTGVPGLDPLLDGGIWRGSTTLVIGPTGAGKTMFGLKYLLDGARSGEPGLLLGFQEMPAQLKRLLAGFGEDVADLEQRGLFQILHVSPLELDLVELVGQVKALMETRAIRRLVIDALGDMEEAAIDRGRFRSVIWTLMRMLSRTGVTGVFLTESSPPHAGAAGNLPPAGLSYLADNVIVLSYRTPREVGADRQLEIIKTRGSAHDPKAYAYRIGATGLNVVS